MDSKEKKELSESDIKAKFITPAIVQAGWDEMTQIRREVTLTPGPVVVRGNLSSRNKKKKKFAFGRAVEILDQLALYYLPTGAQARRAITGSAPPQLPGRRN